jgi:hypothetical protein
MRKQDEDKKLYLLLFKLVVTCKYGLYLNLLFR